MVRSVAAVASGPDLSKRPEWTKAPPSQVHRLAFRDLWRFFWKQPPSFWLVCAYVFFEYVRPQAIYSAIEGWPLPFFTIMACGVACVLERARMRRLMIIDGLLLLFTAIVFASSVTAWEPLYSFENWKAYYPWVIIFYLITHAVDNERKFVVFMLLYFLWCLKMSQFGTRTMIERGFSFASWGLTCAPEFFHNSGECGIQLAMFVPASLYFLIGVWGYATRGAKALLILMPSTAALSIIGSSSRGAQLALAALLMWAALRSRAPFKAMLITAISAAVLYSVLPEEQKDRFRQMGTDETSLTRRQYWSDGIKIMNDYPVLGIGFQNWLPYYKTHYNPWGQLPHNIFVEAGAELGYTGLIAFILLIVATFVVNHRTRRIAKRLPRGSLLYNMAHGLDGALIGYLVAGFFVTVLYYPFFWINLAMTTVLHNVTLKTAREVRSRGQVQQVRRLSPGPRVPPHAAAVILPDHAH